MTDAPIPPSSRGPFRSSASFSNMSMRLSPFTLTQVARLHDLHERMYMQMNIPSEIKFDCGHNHVRATYSLTAPKSSGHEITVALTELRTAPDRFVFSVKCEVDGILQSDETVLKASRLHQDIPEHALQLIQRKMIELNGQIDFDQPLPASSAVYDDFLKRMRRNHG